MEANTLVPSQDKQPPSLKIKFQETIIKTIFNEFLDQITFSIESRYKATSHMTVSK